MTYSSVPGLRAELDGSVLALTFDRADRRNAVNDVMLDALIDHLAAAGTDESVRVIRIDAEGPDFCAGADLIANNAKSERKPRVGSTQRRLPTKANRLIPVLTETQVPIVVRGPRLDGRAGLSHRTRRPTSASPRLTLDSGNPSWLAASPPTAEPPGCCPADRLVRTRQLLMLGTEISGATAAEWGIIHGAHRDDELDTAAAELVEPVGCVADGRARA